MTLSTRAVSTIQLTLWFCYQCSHLYEGEATVKKAECKKCGKALSNMGHAEVMQEDARVILRANGVSNKADQPGGTQGKEQVSTPTT